MEDFILIYRVNKSFCQKLLVIGVLGLAGGLAQLAISRESDQREHSDIRALENAFRNPPEDCKLMMRWWWFGAAVTHEELLRELQEMKKTGVGGVEVQPVYPLTLDDPNHGLVNLPYLSREFLDAIRYTAAASHRLGLRMDVTLGSGWPFGGSHISQDLAAKRLRVLFLPLKNPTEAFPLPKLNPGEKLVGAFVARGEGRRFVRDSVRAIPIVPGDQLHLPTLTSEPHVVIVFIAGQLGMRVKRAAVGAEGLVLDHYNRTALEKHLTKVGEPLLEAAGPGNTRAVFCDSFEVEGSDWTDDLLAEFRQRRGYDLQPYLPALVGDLSSQTEQVRHDWGQTLTELFDERFLSPLMEWARRHHVLTRVQAYGEPPATLSSYKLTDLPDGEQGDESGRWNDFTPARWASSAGHHYGASVVTGETWTWIHSPVFRATPLDLKAGADEQFLEGVTQLVGHGWPYSPPGIPEPSWHFYAAGALNEHNPWWFVMPDLALYLQRTSFMLRQGRPVNDVALYLPIHDAWGQFTAGHVNLWEAVWRWLGPDIVPQLLAAGYSPDFVDDDLISNLATIEGSRLQTLSQRFPIVILPGIERIPTATLNKLADFARSGGILVSTRRLPSMAPGFLDQTTSTSSVRRLVEELFQKQAHPGHFIADERNQLANELSRLYPPDAVFSPPGPEVGFIHRSTERAEIYFICNTTNQRVRTSATLRIENKSSRWWDPFTGKVADAGPVSPSRGGSVLPLDLEPYGSRFLVFTDLERTSKAILPPTPRLPEPFDLSQGWSVTIDAERKTFRLDRLCSWTELDDLRFFSGLATYRKEVTIPSEFRAESVRVNLNFGEPVSVPPRRAARLQAWVDSPVREAAEVYLNDQRVGTVWHPPYELDVTPYLRPGKNQFKLVVGNLAVNEMAGRQLPSYKGLEAHYGRRFEVQDIGSLQALPSGLLGPIRLIAH